MAMWPARRGTEIFAEELAHRLRLRTPPTVPAPAAALAYRAMNSVPEHWIPFIPVHVPGQDRAIRLQRAAIPSTVTGLPVPPRTSLLRQGLDQGHQYYVNEEEVPQSGTRLSLTYNRARWRDGGSRSGSAPAGAWAGARAPAGRRSTFLAGTTPPGTGTGAAGAP
ncbi:hypothetical protein [Streptomyces sp. NPDC058755]|uniref:hypothetical protein n=1 Tax=Streptomyces sp. NPDC058755 TaxID=3346624 RepID=UPI0036AF0FCA